MEFREEKINLSNIDSYLHDVGDGSYDDVAGDHALYYHYLPNFVKDSKSPQIVELGSAAGTSALMMLSQMSPEQHLYACSIPEPEGEFRFITKEYPNLTMIRGNDLDLSVWKGIDLSKTGVWFFDTDHTYEQVHAELMLYDKYFNNCYVFMDDINLNEGMRKAWDEIKYPKQELLHWHSYKNTGFGVFKCPKN